MHKNSPTYVLNANGLFIRKGLLGCIYVAWRLIFLGARVCVCVCVSRSLRNGFTKFFTPYIPNLNTCTS